MAKDGGAFRRYMKFIAATFTLSTLICFLIPNGQDLRPETFERHNIFTALLSFIYSADTNTNVFPSVHVAGCLALCFTALDSEKLRKSPCSHHRLVDPDHLQHSICKTAFHPGRLRRFCPGPAGLDLAGDFKEKGESP